MSQKKKRKTKEEKKLSSAIDTLAEIIDSMASSMLRSINAEETVDLKQVKELAGAVKELSALVSSRGDEEGENDNTLTVVFEGEGENWAR